MSMNRNANNFNLRPNRVRTSLFRDSFFNRIVSLWNNIPLDIRETIALSTFKDCLFNYFFNTFIVVFVYICLSIVYTYGADLAGTSSPYASLSFSTFFILFIILLCH